MSVHFSSITDNHKTPKAFYEKLDKEFSFDFDPCPYTEGVPAVDGLTIEWGGEPFAIPLILTLRAGVKKLMKKAKKESLSLC